ncbi:alpha/beta hydrolase [Actinomycetota bacterium]|nr:alpha/beta hydrolase [Actinomycetota bacterium]
MGATVLALLLAGCSAPKHQAEVTPEPTVTSTDVAPDLVRFYTQQLDWTACGDLECTTAMVPLDWADPAGATIELAVNRSPAKGDDRLGSLLINPGGPGASGTDALSSLALERVSQDVQDRYDMVGFDPRGVAGSSPVTCVDDADMDTLLATDFDFATDAGVQEAEQAYGTFGAACLQNTGPVLGHVDTVSAARDLDVLRAALGDEKLTYLGYSYGTQLGATYAGLFPDRVGRLVLDGALDPTLTSDELSAGQAAGFESALRAYVEDCQAGATCPLTGSADDGMAQIGDLLDRARTSPLKTGTDRRLTAALAFAGIALPLYDQNSWPYLTIALTSALQNGDGSVLLQLSDVYYDRAADGTYTSNSTNAFWSIGCLDDRGTTDIAQMRTEAAAIQEVAPTVGYFFGYGGVLCSQWPVPEVGGLDSYAAEGAAPILVVGTTNDPATPYAWAQRLADLLSSGTLLTYEGEGHTAYGRSNSCISDAVDGYLIDGTVPAEGTRC